MFNMTRPAKLDDATIQKRLAQLAGWSLKSGKLHREFQFADFNEAFAFMAKVALFAEALNHHPEWFNVWNKVRVDLATHDAGGVTDLDFQLAEHMNELTA